MNPSDLQTIYDYYFWANQRLLETAAPITPEQFVAPSPFGNGSLRATLVHLVDDSTGWRNLCQHQTTDHFGQLPYESFPSLDVLLPVWRQEEQAMQDYLTSLTEEELNGTISFTGPDDKKIERPRWQALYHITNHATEHRSAAAAILTDFGYSPGELDLIELWNGQG